MNGLLDRLLGPRCSCGQRVFARDVDEHARVCGNRPAIRRNEEDSRG